MRCLMYLRKSRADREAEMHGEGETLARHEKTLLALADKYQMTIEKIYREIVSGDTIAARPYMQILLNEVAKGCWDGVFVMEIERLARGDTKDQGTVAEAFKIGNTKIITPSKIYDPDNEFDEEYFEFGLFMSRREYKTINRRIQRGRIASVQEGKYIAGTAPYGYEKVKIQNDKGYSLQILPDQAAVVKTIFELYTQGEYIINENLVPLGMSRIGRKLDYFGIKPPKSELWSRSTIKDILTNPVYTGKIRWQHRKSEKMLSDGIITEHRITNEACILVNGLHEPIISDDIFEQAQHIMKSKIKESVPVGKTLKNPLSGLIYCGMCGERMTRAANSKNREALLYCPNTNCRNISAPLSLVEEAVLNGVTYHTDKYIIKEKKLSGNETAPSASCCLKNEMILAAERSLKVQELQLLNTYDFLERGIYDLNTFHERNNCLRKQISATKTEIDSLKKDSNEERPEQVINSQITLNNVNTIADLYVALKTPALKNELLKILFHHITYTKNYPNKKGRGTDSNFTLTLYPNI